MPSIVYSRVYSGDDGYIYRHVTIPMYLTYLFNQDTFKANVKVPKCSANKKKIY